jgi:Delta7-sterol 5-desaturase
LFDTDVPLPLVLLQTFVTQAGGYFLAVGLLFLLVWRWGKKRFARRRIQAVERVDRAQLQREVGYTLVTLVVGMSSAGGVLFLHHHGLARIVTTSVPFWVTLLWVIALIAFNDAWFYGWHRLLHRPWWYRHVHSVHHKSVDVNPFTSYSFHGVEAFILGAWIVPAAFLLPLPVSALLVVQAVGLLNNVMSHLGYEFLPRWLVRVPVLRLTNTATFHSLHHTRLQGNFGLHTRIWDRCFGTEVPEYEATFVARGDAHRAAVR